LCILGKRLYKERQVSRLYWDMVRKSILVLKSCVHTCMKHLQPKVCGYQPAIGRWAYQVKKEEEEQINVVLFVNEN
jgi:hypothetical protein